MPTTLNKDSPNFQLHSKTPQFIKLPKFLPPPSFGTLKFTLLLTYTFIIHTISTHTWQFSLYLLSWEDGEREILIRLFASIISAFLYPKATFVLPLTTWRNEHNLIGWTHRVEWHLSSRLSFSFHAPRSMTGRCCHLRFFSWNLLLWGLADSHASPRS